MINIASESDKIDIIKELKKDILNNVYMYIDILTYGLNKDFMKVWICRDNNKIKKIVLKYYNSFQIYVVEGEQDYTDIISLILEYKPAMVSGKKDIIEKLYRRTNELYEDTYGVVLTQPYVKITKSNIYPTLAEKEDLEESAKLICTDKGIGGHYNPIDLMNQFINRYEDRTGRNYIIKDNGNIIAHYATYAEAEGIAVMGGLIVSEAYRGKGYARLLHTYLSNILIEEERKAVLFCHEENVLKMYLNLGAKIHSSYGKLTLKN
ncbi:GNAT family N-acetyltransferase [Clostridium sp.]|uniref:GNAT family N-acetyltransferase n=1 Tax=Clostridium sp. TaxID=1506 RepID=UPI002909B89A|nr:GNAT family N-acetyltransferase [Clostridium sp.]MDU5108233.1 GNAT family N-acetyltransferase [Clostridium sp.]